MLTQLFQKCTNKLLIENLIDVDTKSIDKKFPSGDINIWPWFAWLLIETDTDNEQWAF